MRVYILVKKIVNARISKSILKYLAFPMEF